MFDDTRDVRGARRLTTLCYGRQTLWHNRTESDEQPTQASQQRLMERRRVALETDSI